MTRALPLLLMLFACRTARPDEGPAPAAVTELKLDFAGGKGDLSFTVEVPGFHEPTDVHWQLFLDERPVASGVAVVQPQSDRFTVTTPVRPHGLRYDDGARFVQVRLEGDAQPESPFASSRLFSYKTERVMTGAPLP